MENYIADKKYQVFISSTYSDLKEERRKILDILLMADCIPSGMEAFVATDNEQFEVIKKVIDLCDYYVLIIGKRYGSVNSLTRISYTEMEYDYAKSKEIPVLVFAIDENVELPEYKTESDQSKLALLKLFRNKAMENRLVSIWKSVDELTGALAISIMRAQKEILRPGWQRAVDYDEVSLRREIMDLQRNNENLQNKLNESVVMLKKFTDQTDISYENCVFEVGYYYFTENHVRHNGKTTLRLPHIFIVIATEMMNVSITELSITRIVEEKCLKSGYSNTIDDSQFVKRVLNQLKALDLLSSKWIAEKSQLYWGLTVKGIKERDDAILIRDKKPQL